MQYRYEDYDEEREEQFFKQFDEAFSQYVNEQLKDTKDTDEKEEIVGHLVRRHHKHISIFLKDFEKKYIEHLWIKGEYYPLRWMLSNPAIHAVLHRYPKLIPILNYLDKVSLKPDHNRTVAFSKRFKFQTTIQSGKSKGKKISYQYSFILTDNEFYEKMTKELGIPKKLFQKYIQQLKEIGIINYLDTINPGKENKILYTDGYYIKWDDFAKARKVRFLNKKEHAKKLEMFRIKR
ncbi:MAG: hypothetical protein P9L89_05875 [Candidatus Celaenobacter polaris]|nr:hypothetical protein [Candidatus Celaenobacter polaris]